MRICARTIRPETAFTLIELLVVLVIMAIAAAVVVPMAVSTSDISAVSAARLLATDLQYAQNTAITTQEPVTVTFTPASEQYALSNASGTLIHPITKDAYMIDFASRRGFGQLDVVSADFGGNPSIVFDEMGTPDNAGQITLQAGPHVYTVGVAAATGKVSVTSVQQ